MSSGLPPVGKRTLFRVSATDPRAKSAARVREDLDLPSLSGDNTFTGANTIASQGSLTVDGPLAATGAVTLNGGITDNSSDPAVFNHGVEVNDEAKLSAGVRLATVAKAGAYTLTDADCIVNATSGTWAATLPSAVARLGKLFVVRNSGAGVVTVTPDGAETIDGAATLALAATQVARLVSDGANWITV